ncbi:MAG: undecaprenyl/decaprenyl-phosphate alpha-N-acetylglucosaminyl 1-phosphate transferase [Actinobacteria bacterium]|nr:undecaprenyl/decaprenyl-phosphate alpha-N-acetylglucosaminyl 1-phosphate transferase [Actinomycetota bacterium]
MRVYLITAFLAAAICYLVTPFVKRVAEHFGVVAQIRSRDVHTLPTARWGGVAMWISMVVTFLIARHLTLVDRAFGQELQGVFLASTFVIILGMADDRYQLDAITKLAGQALAAGILLLYGIQILWLPINGVTTLPPSIGQAVTVLIVVVIINAVNFVDGLDGLAAGIVAIAGASFFAFAYLLAVVNGFSRAGSPSLITALIVGVCIGFLPHNSHPAKIFMGDSGSMFLGLLLAAAAITLTGQVDANAIAAEEKGPTLLPLLLPFAILAIPLMDLILAIFRRAFSGRSPFAPDKEHLHHRLMVAGNSQQRSVLIMYFWTAAVAVPTTLLAFLPLWVGIVTAIVLVGISLAISQRWFERGKRREKVNPAG